MAKDMFLYLVSVNLSLKNHDQINMKGIDNYEVGSITSDSCSESDDDPFDDTDSDQLVLPSHACSVYYLCIVCMYYTHKVY